MGNEVPVLTMKEFVPAELHEKPYMKEWLDKPWDKDNAAAFFKKHDGIESLLGKRPAIPGKDAKPEELLKHFEAFAPEKADDYEIPLTEGAAKPDEGFLKAVKAAFHAGKINKAQATGFLQEMQKFGATAQKMQAEATQRKAAEFDTLAKSMLGDKGKEVMARAKVLWGEFAPQAVKSNQDKLTDEQMIAVAAILDGIVQKYMPADDIAKLGKPKSDTGTGGANDVASKRAQMHDLMKSKSYKDPFAADHAEVLKKVDTLSREMSALMGK